jgi:hypothetical protein
MNKNQISTPIIIDKPFSYQILQNVLLQLDGNDSQSKNNQVDLLHSMSMISNKYVKLQESAAQIIWGHPNNPTDNNSQITYKFANNQCSIGYGRNAAANILVLPNENHAPEIISIHDNHYHLKGQKRDDVILQAASKSCSNNPSALNIESVNQYKGIGR